MAKIEEGGAAQTVPLVRYDENGERHVVGTASVQLVSGEVLVTGTYDEGPTTEELVTIGLEAFSVGQ